MSAGTVKRGSGVNLLGHGNVVRPQPVTERTLMESVAGLINEVGLATQPSNGSEETEHKVLWTRIDSQPNDLRNGADLHGDSSHTDRSLMITLGYANGVQMWKIPVTGEAQEVLSWKRPGVRLLRILPYAEDTDADQQSQLRPVVLLYEGSTGTGASPHQLTFVSLKSAEVLKSLKFNHQIYEVKANATAIVASFLDKIMVIDPCKFDIRTTITVSEITGRTLVGVPFALGTSWLGFGDRRILPALKSGGGAESAVTPSYTATVIYAAKSLTKGLKELGETVASSFVGHRMPVNPDNLANAAPEPGVVTVLNLAELKAGEFSLDDLACVNSGTTSASVIAHFVAHCNQPVFAMSFDPSGLLLVTADKTGHDFHVFRIHPHPLGSTMGSVHHLYVLHRGDTGAKVQDISFAPDSRWISVSTFRGTTHIFPITPYGGTITVRTHTGPRVVNRLSRFQRTAGLDDAPTSDRCSPISSPFTLTTSASIGIGSNNKTLDLLHIGSPYPNPRFPPFSHPVVVSPLAQLRQSFMPIATTQKQLSPQSKSKGGLMAADERVFVNTVFSETRGWVLNNPLIVASCDKRKKPLIESLFVLTSHGNLIEYVLEPAATSVTQPKEKIPEDSPIELSVHAIAEWNFSKPSFRRDLHPPLAMSSGSALSTGDLNGNRHTEKDWSNPGDKEEPMDEKWLAHVEMSTHCGPVRRLWMCPQFSFKVITPVNGSAKNINSEIGTVDVETIEVSVRNRPAKSNPLNMPMSTNLLPEIVSDNSGSSLEPSPQFSDLTGGSSENGVVQNESQIKQNLAEAMMENCAIASRESAQEEDQSLHSSDDFSSSSVGSSDSSSSSVDPSSAPTFSIDLDAGYID